MRITEIHNNFKYNPKQSFKRAPSDKIVLENGLTEAQEYPLIVKQAKDFLGLKNLALILHQSSFPVKKNDIYKP